MIVACQESRLCLAFAGAPARAGSRAADLHRRALENDVERSTGKLVLRFDARDGAAEHLRERHPAYSAIFAPDVATLCMENLLPRARRRPRPLRMIIGKHNI